MLVILFQAGPEIFAMDTRELVEIVPSFDLRHMPGAATGVAGIMRYRNAAIPVLDLGVLMGGSPCQSRLSTRILVVRYRADTIDAKLGLRVENATETLKIAADDLQSPGVVSPGAEFLGPVFEHESGLVQLVNVEHLLSESLAATLYAEARTL